MKRQRSILFIDAYDSFSENVVALLHQLLDVTVTVIKIDTDIRAQFHQDSLHFFKGFDAIVLGPGPGNPNNESDVGLFDQVWQYAAPENVPILGVCLGFQSLCRFHGVPVTRMALPCHGHAKHILHSNLDIFHDTGEIVATNYNSLGVLLRDLQQSASLTSRANSSSSIASLSSSQSVLSQGSILSKHRSPTRFASSTAALDVLAWDQDGYVMAVKHQTYPFWGFQFHPESCKSNGACRTLLEKWWDAAQCCNSVSRACTSISSIQTDHVPQTVPQFSDSPAASNVFNNLMLLSQSCTNTVLSNVAGANFHHQQIAEMCRMMSPGGSIAMLESTKKGRFSIYAFPYAQTFQVEYRTGQCNILQGSSVVNKQQIGQQELLAVLENFVATKQAVGGVPDLPFWGGFVGFLSYELGISALQVPVHDQAKLPSHTPDLSLLWIERSIVLDNRSGIAYVQSVRQNDHEWIQTTLSKLETLAHVPTSPLDEAELEGILASARFSLPDHDRYVEQIRDCQSELLQGNSYELCLTTEATVTTPTGLNHSWKLYQNLQHRNPVPFAAYLHLHHTTIISSSPEQFLTWSRDGAIDMVPMKGTVKKTADMTRAKATQILSSAKESAENLMIADLIRHDLYSTVGWDAKVEVMKLCDVVEHETVYQLVSHIRAHVPVSPSLDPDQRRRQDVIKYGHKALRKTIPPGSMTGAPKKRSCEILHRLEQRPRGVYSGVIGYMDIGGGGGWNVCIRTAFSNAEEDEDGRQTWRIGAGGAITVLSDEEEEWEEMRTKLDSVLHAFRPG